MAKNGKKKKWIKLRHRITQRLMCWTLKPILVRKFDLEINEFKDKKGQYLFLYNHQTGFDQFFIGFVFHRLVYYVATEDIFSIGLPSKFIRALLAPVPFKKSTADFKAVMNCLRIVKEGGSIALAPEGNRTYSGRTEFIKPSVVKLAKSLGIPVAFVKIEGGYGAMPRWTDEVRKGKVKVGVSKVITPETYNKLSDDEFYEIIKSELYVDENKITYNYPSKVSAEHLERALYVCPKCKGFAKFESSGEFVRCTNCGLTVKYNGDKTLSSDDKDFNYKFFGEWYDYQNKIIASIDKEKYISSAVFSDKANIYKVIVGKNKKLLSENVSLKGYSDRMTVEGKINFVFDFNSVDAVAVLGKNKLNVYYKDDIYQFKGDVSFNALKYVNLYYAVMDNKEDKYGKFLGI